MNDNKETVKLIIEIPKIDKELLDEGRCGETRKEAILYAVMNGIPLDSVKAEISKEYAKTHHIFLNYASGLDAALRIIDKCISKESEDKE